MSITPMKHQVVMADTWANQDLLFNTSDPGTGKTIGTLLGYQQHKKRKRMLVLCPLSIMEPSWLDDAIRLFEDAGISCAIAHGAKKRLSVLEDLSVDIVITNHDAVKWIMAEAPKETLYSFSHIAIDESTAFKNHNSQRSKACAALVSYIPNRCLMTGTPNPKGITDLWHQAYLLDGGKRLGRKFYAFRASVCDMVLRGPITDWVEREEAVDFAFDKLKDIVLRFKREDCIDLPPNTLSMRTLDMPAWVAKKYKELQASHRLEDEGITAINAASKVTKMLQLLSGALYDNEGNAVKVHKERYELIIELVKERKHSLVAFNWQHQKEQLVELAKKEGIAYAVIDGSTGLSTRTKAVEDFQAGRLQVIFAHPQSAGHGLTLTKGTATIWASPTYNAEHYEQFNARIFRKGQSLKTETIRIGYKNSIEMGVFEKLDNKLIKMTDLLGLMRGD